MRPEEEELVRGDFEDDDDERDDLGFTDEEDDEFNDRSDHEVDLTDAEVIIPEPCLYKDDSGFVIHEEDSNAGSASKRASTSQPPMPGTNTKAQPSSILEIAKR